MKKTISKLISLAAILALILSLAACGSSAPAATSAPAAPAENEPVSEVKSFKVGICNYVDDPSLNQIVENIEKQLAASAAELGVTIDVAYDNCNADATVMEQIIANFIADGVDLMVGVATPVAMTMQAATEENGIPVVFAAVSDPLAVGLVDTLEAPGANITGTSDFLNTDAIMNLILVQNPDIKTVGLLYDVGQDSSATPIAAAKAFLEAKGIEVIERTGTNVQEVMLAAEALVTAGVEAVFTPTDNTIMTAELSIYETFAEAGIPHYTGADSFALNGAFLGYGVDYIQLGLETGKLVIEILVNGADPASTPVLTFDNGIATVNLDICEALELSFDDVAAAFEPYCTQVQSIVTADDFSDLAG